MAEFLQNPKSVEIGGKMARKVFEEGLEMPARASPGF